MARTYADIQRLKTKQVEAEVIQSVPPGYLEGGKLDINSTYQVEVYPFVANIWGKYAALNTTHTILSSEFMVNRLGGAWYYVYADSGLLFYVDSLAPTYNSVYHAQYHPENNWRYLGKIYTSASDPSVISDAVNQGSIAVEDIEASFISADMIAVGAVTTAIIATDAITADLLATDCVTTQAIAASAVTSAELAGGAATAAVLATAAVTTAAIGASQITATLIASDAVITRHILASNIVGAHIAAGEISAEKIAVGSISATCIDVTSLTVHTLNVTDTYGRYIEISGAKGLYAQDISGTIIHDIPDAQVLTGWIYGGHLLFLSTSYSILDTLVLVDGEDNATGITATALSNFDLSTFTYGLTNIHGALVRCHWAANLANAKMDTNAEVTAYFAYSRTYNTVEGGYSLIHYFKEKPHGLTNLERQESIHAIVPVIYNSSTPYITWYGRAQFSGMASVSGIYGFNAGLYLLGYLI